MVAIGRSSHAFFFDGVSESIIVPQGRFTKLGDNASVGTTNTKTKKTPSDILSKTGYGKDETTKINSRFDNQFTVEAWVVPDCGGVIVERQGQFLLELGTVDTPGPAKFTVFLDTTDGTKTFTLTTASNATTRWDGVVYPEQDYGGVHDSYNRYDLGNYNDATNLNFNHRPLYHIVGAVTDSAISLFINGQVVISQTLPNDASISDSTAHVYIGGKGGDFRGAIESIHFATQFDEQIITPNVPMDDQISSTGLYRFEEPLDIIEEEYEFTAFTAASNGTTTTLTIPATDAQSLIKRLTGKEYDATSATTDFTLAPHSMGNYEIHNNFTAPNNVATSYLPHVPYNLIINPGAINRNTQKPNQTPPERLRILSINGSTGVITVNSIHLDFNVASSGSRGILHSRTTDVDNYFVIIPADLVIDLVTGKPYQPPHFNTQIIDKTGQMVLDETDNEQHGIVYSSQMATTTSHPNNPFAVTWPSTLDVNYQIGHSGRHKFSHIKGHEYMRRYPRPTSLQIDQVISGSADIVQMDYANTASGLHRLFNTNELADFYDENSQSPIQNIVNSTKASSVFTNGLPASKEEIIAISIGDHKPFMLKGPIPENYSRTTLTTDERDYHIRPETESRIALLHVPTLRTTHNLAPYVEIHYNALDLLGDSMQTPSASPTPMLMVEKTVPKGSTILTGTTTILDVIKADLANASKDSTIYSPGGYIDLDSAVANQNDYFEKTNSLVGDNAGGAEYDFEISYDTSPINYTPPSDVNAQPATTPQVITSSHNKGTHQSVFHKLCIEPMSVDKANKLEDLGNNQFKKKAEKVNSSQGVFDVGGIHQGSPIFEMFDIIDNLYIGTKNTSARIYIQPSNRNRTNQLAKLRDGVEKGETANIISLFYLMSRTRIRSVKQIIDTESNSMITQVTASGIAEEAINEDVTFMGSGSPDSHVVKEIDIDAPVVSVTLGGPGQGAINTKPTYDPSPLMRLPGSTRRNCAVKAISVCTLDDAKTISVQPLNNKSEDLQSWGTYAFPKKGRIFLEGGGNAEYASKVGAGFVFDDTDALAQRKYLSVNDEIFSTFNEWCIGVGLVNNASKNTYSINKILFNDDNFNFENMCEDGSTVNDRLFQAIDDVTHDYQLSTQYASTRAMVEIPVFPQQFFGEKSKGIFPGPDNSMKLHLDATYTAHTWNSSPVGRRVDDLPPNDRIVKSAYESKSSPVKSRITKIVINGDFLDLYVDNHFIFTPGIAGDLNNFKDITMNGKVFLEDGSWAYISNNPYSDEFVRVRHSPTSIGDGGLHGFCSDDFINKLTTGCTLSTSRSISALESINSDVTTPTSDYEGRSIFYHDSANVQTQGGNLDYGLRQYVSAVEFKAGPLSNPHAPRIKSKRATARIIQATQLSSSQVYALQLDNVDSFIDTTYTLDSSGNPEIGIGDLLIIGKILTTTPIEVLYLGSQFNNQFSFNANDNNTVLVQFGTGVTVPSLQDIEFRLEKIGRSHLALSNIAQVTSQELTVSTFRPVVNDEIYSFDTAHSAGSTDEITFDNGPYRNPAANSLGVNIRPGDMIYKEDLSSGAIGYVGIVKHMHSEHYRDVTSGSGSLIKLTANNVSAIGNNDILRIGINSIIADDSDAILNNTWRNPYAAGGLRNGDTVWMNMTMNNAHAVEGLFCKSRGVLNEGQVYKAFNGGEGQLTNRPRDSIPLENFLIGDSCLETAVNFVQHVNKTIELNYEAMGLSASQAPTVAYIDPYLSSEKHTRVLLYDVAHDREFISFHDIQMQVQTSPSVPVIGHTRNLVADTGYYSLDEVLVKINGGAPHYLTTQIDVANGFPSENKYLRSTQQSKFIESAYAHNVPNMKYNNATIITLENPLDEIGTLASPTSSIGTLPNLPFMGKGHGHFVHSNGYHGSSVYHVSASSLPRIEPATFSSFYGNKLHNKLKSSVRNKNISSIISMLKEHRTEQGYTTHTFKDSSTLFDTPDGTRVISAFLCLKGIRNESLNLINHEESRLQHLPQWKNMDYIRRQTIDFGEIGVKIGGTNIEAAAREIVRLINQGAAKNGRTHARRPSNNYPGESEKLDINRIGVREDITDINKDPASAHVNADFAATGSTHDPAPFWSVEHAMTSQDRGSHMGYLRAHLGRVVEDSNGSIGYTIVIHSTVPGASGRNFCVWLDNSKGQSPYQPKFLVGHGGRFRNFWCQQEEMMGENMHPAPMPLNKDGRPFAPITTLKELIKEDNRFSKISNNNDDVNSIIGSGSYSNTIFTESFEGQSQTSSIVEGLRVGTRAIGRINFGGLVASGIPGFAPVDGELGVGTIVSSVSTTYHQYTTVGEYNSSIGNTQLYGFRLTDHRGKSYGIRYIYKQLGEEFVNDETFVPNTLSEEVGIFINHKDISEGGFTIKNNITGSGDVTGQLSNSGITAVKSYNGNRFNGVYSPDSVINASVKWESTNNTLTVKFYVGSIYNPNSASELQNVDDILGYLGFPKTNGVIQLNDTHINTTLGAGFLGHTLSYTSRTQLGVGTSSSSTHIFYGVKGSSMTVNHQVTNAGGEVGTTTPTGITSTTAAVTHPSGSGSWAYLAISSRMNWTTLLTDEVLAAAMEAAINATNVTTEEGIPFDCRHLLAADGRRLGDWGISADAIRIRAFDVNNENLSPPSTMFECILDKDRGIEAAHQEYGLYKTFTQTSIIKSTSSSIQPLSDLDLTRNKFLPCGYIPKTVLQIVSKGRGFHANTPTPILVDSSNHPIDISNWSNNLKGISYTRNPGDHILPYVNEITVPNVADVKCKSSVSTVSIVFGGNKYPRGTNLQSRGIGGGKRLQTTAFGTGFVAGTIYEATGGTGHGLKLRFPFVDGSGRPVTTSGGSTLLGLSSGTNNQFFELCIVDTGEGYTVGDTLSVTPASGSAHNFTVLQVSNVSGFQAKATNTSVGGIITGISISNRGTGATTYTSGTATVTTDYITLKSREEDFLRPCVLKVTAVLNESIEGLCTFSYGQNLHSVLVPASIDTNTDFTRISPKGETGTFFVGSQMNGKFRNDGNELQALQGNTAFVNKFSNPLFIDTNVIFVKSNDYQITGRRFYGSVDSEPIVYFRGAKDSKDHSVPLYFGGGFSGVTLDINDGTQNDYASFYTHPYSNGPTGTAGIQNANEITTSFATIDCNALFAFFPGASLVNQNRGSYTPPAYNKNNILSPDVFAGYLSSGGPSWINSKYAAGVIKQKPVPLVLQFAHPTARYDDFGEAKNIATTSYTHGNVQVKNKTSYHIYGPGQAIPFSESTNNIAGGSYPTTTQEPHPGTVVTVGNTWSKVPYNMNLPNALTNDVNVFAPPTSAFQVARHKYHFAVPTGQALNWSPPEGIPNIGMLKQRPSHGYHYGEHFIHPVSGKITASNSAEYRKAHPFKHCAMAHYGIAMSADMTWHMDGGYHPGGHWLDNQVAVNFKNHTSNAFVVKWGSTPVHPTAFRVSSRVLSDTVSRSGVSATYNQVDGSTVTTESDVIIVDATRCQNGEELATIIGQAINENPGKGALKALGGTFMPSMGNANRQDRYGWIELDFVSYNLKSGATIPNSSGEYFGDGSHGFPANGFNYVIATITGNSQIALEQIPMSGWIRTDKGGRDKFVNSPADIPMFAPYHTREIINVSSNTYRVVFWLAPNRISGLPLFEDGYTFYDKCQTPTQLSFPSPGTAVTVIDPDEGEEVDVTFPQPTKVFVWSKAGVHRFNNESEANRDHMTQVHFSGLVDAIDRTRPVGAVGWAGERYSYLNSLKVETDGGGNKLYAAGLGAWYEKLGFSPYGSSNSCMGLFGVIPSQGIQNSPDASPIINGRSNYLTSGMGNPYTVSNMFVPTLAFNNSYYTNYTFTNTVGSPHFGSVLSDVGDQNAQLGVYSRAFLVVSHESELPLVAKYDRDGIRGLGDWLNVVSATKAGTAAATAITYAGTTRWDERFHGANRFIAPATAGPKVEALITPNLQIPTDDIPALGVHESYPLLGKTESIDLVANLTGVASGANTEVTTSGGVTTAGLAVGMYLSHANLPINTQIVSIESTTKFLINTTPSTTGSATVKLIAFGDDDVSNATPCLHPTGDISNDLRISPATKLLNNSSIHLNRQGFQTELNTPFDQMVDRTELQADYGTTHDNAHISNTNAFNVGRKSVSRNFTVENVVWKRMDGGNLSLPSSNAKGLGAVPLITRVKNNAPLTMGEKIFGNNRFSFETTNSSMFPIIQAQELMHPQHATKSPNEIKNALNIPNEEIQFKSISVEDDTGQVHTIEGGSPFGTIIRGFRKISDRASEGLAPAVESDEEKYVGVEPNLEIQLPDPNTIPGNILVRSGFDSIQAYQNETIGSGGMMRPSHNNHNGAGQIFDEDFDKLNGEAGAVTIDSPRLGPTYEDYGWEHISQKLDGDIKFPDSTKKGWTETTGNNPLNTSYKQHDRTLFFHVTKKSLGFTEKYPVGYSHTGGVVTQELSITASDPDKLTINGNLDSNIFDIPIVGVTDIPANINDVDSSTYYRIKNTDTGQEGLLTGRAVASRLGSGYEFYNPVLTKEAAKILYKNDNIEDIDFTSLPTTTYSNVKIYPSFPVPAGNTRFYAARRLRDHAEVSGNSPDAKHQSLRQGGISFSEVYALISQGEEVENVAYYRFEGGGDGSLIDYFEGMNLTPMAVPRMGHHFVNATMAVMPGHWAHPAYQNLYHKHRACRSATLAVKEKLQYEAGGASVDADTHAVYDPMLVFGGMTATPSGPSDIHGGAFTLMFETKIKHDGYGILASEGEAGTINKQGGHTIVLRAGYRNTFNKHFPDPSKVGAYQIIIQPNVFSSQLVGFHENGPNNDLPNSSVINLTSQQTALVVGIRELDTATGGMALVLANATMADVRGCEVMINEVMLDHDPDHGGQFTNIPNLMTYNPFGVQGTETPAFTRQSLPYHPQMFVQSTPGMTTNIPWWSIVHPQKPTITTGSNSAKGFRFLSHHRLDNYYLFIRANTGSIGAQLTLAGYPSTYPNMYDEVLRSVSLNPNCVFISESSNVLTVDDASDFPIEPMYGEMIYYIDANGVRRTSNWSTRSGFAASPSNTINRHKFINLSSPPAGFVSNLQANVTILRLTKQNDISRNAAEIFTDSERSIMTRTLPQTLQGSRDTNSLHLPDSFICSWSPYLGISLTDYDFEKLTPNHMPTTFETIHYHDSTYYASLGPFALDIQTPKIITSLATNRLVQSHGTNTITTNNTGANLSSGDRISVDGRIYTVQSDSSGVITVREQTPNEITVNSAVMTGGIGDGMNGTPGKDNAGNAYRDQGGFSSYDNPTMSIQLYNFWPCGSRGGPIVSRLDGFGYVSTGWMKPTSYNIDDAGPIWHDDGDDGSYDVNAGVDEREYENRLGGWASYTSGDMPNTRPRPFGYRFGLRQPYNKPRWAWYGMRAYLEDVISSGAGSVDYKHGPLIEGRHRSNTWIYAGGKSSPSGGNSTFDTTYVGILERQTNFAGMENILGGNVFNKYGKVTRYSDGMRMTRPFGCPVRTLRNNSDLSANTETNLLYKPHIRREWLGDGYGHGILDVALASQYYLIDWWGNTRGEDVRRMPVRGFGISPAWSSKEANIENLYSNKFITGSATNPYNPFYMGHTFYNFKKIIPASHGGLGTKLEYRLDVSATTTDLCNAPYDVIPSQVGSYNAINSNIKNEIVDFYFPERPTRVGDEGNGRGIRPPTSFINYFFRPLDILDELPTQVVTGRVPTTKGAVLSHNTAEPNIGNGYIRPKNTVLDTDEVPRGISARLKIDDYGLLKPDATLSHRQLSQKPNTVYLNTPYTDVVSRSSPKIGLDVENFEGIDNNAMIITTEAHSLHTNYQVGQRGILQNIYIQTQLNEISTSYKSAGAFNWYFNNASMFKNLGGTNILELKNYSAPVSLGDWGTLPTSGLVLWLRADSLQLNDGDSVDTWHDQSGDGRNFTQSTASKKPTFVASDATFNSKPCLSFDGSDQLSLAFDTNLNTNEFTIFMVMSVTNDNDGFHLGYESRSFNASDTPERRGFNLYADMTGDGSSAGHQWEFWVGADTGWSAARSATGSISLNQPDLVTMFIDGGNGAGATVTAQTLRVDGTVVQTLTPAYYKTHAGLTNGDEPQSLGILQTSSHPLIGKIAEVIQFNRHLTDNEISQWESYLSIKYGITIPNQYKSPNPYFTGTYNADANKTEREISLMLRPIKKINSLSVQFFNAMNLHSGSPQYVASYSSMSIHQLTVGGKYGIFAYDMPNARASAGFYLRATNPDTNPPYAPIYNNTLAHTQLVLKGNNPTLSDIDTKGITYTDTVRRIPSMNNTVGRVVISENTLQHYRADASRKKTVNEDGTKTTRKDFTVQPRFSQSLHPKGHKGDVSFNDGDHTGDGS